VGFLLAIWRLGTPGFEPYVREPTEQEEAIAAVEAVRTSRKHVEAARNAVRDGKAHRGHLRSLLQEKKALHRVFGKGDWVLSARERNNKAEPHYTGPYLVVQAHNDDSYTLATPGGETQKNRYHGQHLFPAFEVEGHPIRSLWYGSKSALEQERKRLARLVADGKPLVRRRKNEKVGK
jgi:hypothetical protein